MGSIQHQVGQFDTLLVRNLVASTTGSSAITSGAYLPVASLPGSPNVTLTGSPLGSPSGYYIRVGNVVTVYVSVTLGIFTSGSAQFFLTLPIASSNTAVSGVISNNLSVPRPFTATSTDGALVSFVCSAPGNVANTLYTGSFSYNV